jgi:hypothetical protein
MQTTRAIVPAAKYRFAGLESGTAERDLLQSLAVIGESDAEVLVFGYGPASTALIRALQVLSAQMVVVVAAGNSGGGSSFAPLDDVALVVGASDGKGQPASFSASTPRSIFAPGVSIPTVSAATGQITAGSGTSYSAAFAGAAAALLKAEHPTATPAQIVSAIRDTAKQPNRLIDVAAARQNLAEKLQPAVRIN